MAPVKEIPEQKVQSDVSVMSCSIIPDALVAQTKSATDAARVSLLRYALLSSAVYAIAFCYYHSSLVDERYVNHHISNLIVTIPAVVTLLWSYWRGYAVVKMNPHLGLKTVVALGTMVAAAAVFVPNFHSSDVFSYIDVGWQQAHYHQNPYITTVKQIPNWENDPMFTGAWAWNPCPYGFFFAEFSHFVCWLGQGNLDVTLAIMKAFNFVAFAALGGLVYAGAKRFQVARPDLSLYMYLWSPFVLMQTLTNAHNDVLMTLFVMGGMLLTATNFVAFSIAAIAVGASIKFVWLGALPFVSVFIARRGGIKSVAQNYAIAALVIAASAVPFVGEVHKFRFDVMQQDLSFNTASFPALLENIGHGIEKLLFHSTTLPWYETGLRQFVDAVELSTLVGFAIFALILFWGVVKKGKDYDALSMLKDSILIVLLAVCVVSSKFHPWYVLMFFPATLWLPEKSELRRVAMTLTCTQLFAITYIGHSGGLNYVLLTATPLIYFLLRKLRRRTASSTGISEH